MAFTVANARDDLLLKLGIESSGSASATQLADVVSAINTALQVMHSAGEDFFTRTKIDVTFNANDASKDMADSVQSVLGPVRLPTGVPLRALESRGQLDTYGPLYLGQTGYAVAAGTPQAYWVECIRQSADDMAKTILHLVPKPSSGMTVVVEGVEDAVRYVVGDLSSSSAIKIPHQYAETIFLPLARMAITRSIYFSRAELRGEIEKDYQVALATLGLKGGFPPESKPDNREVAE